jgi:hypothetical protein
MRRCLFPQMAAEMRFAAGWTPMFADCMYVSFTNSTAFSPTDMMRPTRRIKLLMLLRAGVSLLTLALVGARAVNIIG